MIAMESCSTSCGWCTSDSDQCTWSGTSSEEDPELRRLPSDTDSAGSPVQEHIQDDRCPHCHDQIEDAVILECGHALCAECSEVLVELLNGESRSLRRRGIRMGVAVSYCSLKSHSDWSLPPSSLRPATDLSPVYRSPRCPLCGEAPKTTPPKRCCRVENAPPRHVSPETVVENPMYAASHCYDNVGFEDATQASTTQNISAMYQFLPIDRFHTEKTTEQIIDDARITTCNVSIIGAKKTGKSCLAKRQFLNEVFFGENDDELDDIGMRRQPGFGHANDRRSEGIKSRFMIEIIDGGDGNMSLMHTDALILIYSVVDRKSFYEVMDLHRVISRTRGSELPMVVVGTKADIDKKCWQVASHEGQTLARHIGCPFVEVSARTNDRVHEAFVELMRIVDRRHTRSRRLISHPSICDVSYPR